MKRLYSNVVSFYFIDVETISYLPPGYRGAASSSLLAISFVHDFCVESMYKLWFPFHSLLVLNSRSLVSFDFTLTFYLGMKYSRYEPGEDVMDICKIETPPTVHLFEGDWRVTKSS